MRYILAILTIFLFSYSYGQVEMRKSSLSAGGGVASSGNLYAVYTIGEIGVQEVDAGSMHLSEGFVGPDLTYLLGVEDYGQLEGWQIYPNPVVDQLNIQLAEAGNYEVHLFDMTGKELWERHIEADNQAVYQMTNYQPGIYLISVIDRKNKKTMTIKLQKQ